MSLSPLPLLVLLALVAPSFASIFSRGTHHQPLDLRLEHVTGARASAALPANAARDESVSCRSEQHFSCVTLLLANRGSSPVSVDSRATPLEGFVSRADAFRVVDLATGRELRYEGVRMKRDMSEAAAQPVEIAPGAEIAVDVDLADSYLFEEGRDYSVQLRSAALGRSSHRVAPGGARSHALVAAATTAPPHVRDAERRARSPGAQFTQTGCTADDALDTAVANAKAGLVTAYDEYIVTDKCSTGDYEEWFGEPSGARYDEVVLTLRKTQELLNSDDFIFECGADRCTPTTYAYVFPSDSTHRIHLCNAYRSASTALAYNSKPGTIIHEISHFQDVGDTEDHVYGQTDARSLATNDPAKASDNADSFEFFVEFVPSTAAGCDSCATSGASSCSSCTNAAAVCGFCNSTNQCSRGDLCGSFAYDCADGSWFDDTECVAKDAPSACTATSSSSGEELEISAGTIGAVVVIGAIVFCVMRSRKGKANPQQTQLQSTGQIQ